MTREIKFRAWNKEINTMGSALPLRVWTDDIATDIGREKYLRDRDNIILMQFTGLKDKNGKEIYEGDIIKRKMVRYEVNFDRGAFRKKTITGFPTNEPLKMRNVGTEFFEVIGNIYENPELLK